MNKNQPNLGLQRFLIGQLLFVSLISLILLITWGKMQCLSALLGGLVAFIPMIIFVKTLFAHQGAQAARQIIRGFYVGEFLKIIVSILLFFLVFYFLKVIPLTFFLMYIAVVMSHWIAPLVINNKQ